MYQRKKLTEGKIAESEEAKFKFKEIGYSEN
jgi:hypothetical protein